MAKLTFYGATEGVTGSSCILQTGGRIRHHFKHNLNDSDINGYSGNSSVFPECSFESLPLVSAVQEEGYSNIHV